MAERPDGVPRHAAGADPSPSQNLHSHITLSSGNIAAHPQRRNRSLWQQPVVVVLAAAAACLLSRASALELQHASRLKLGDSGNFLLRKTVMQRPCPWIGMRLRGGVALNVTADHVPANGDDKANAPIDAAVGIADAKNSTVDELKIEALRKLGASLRIGGPGTRRRKFKIVRKKQSKADEARFQNALRRVGINQLNDIEEVQMFKNDGTVLNFQNPRVAANVHTNSYVVTGAYEEQKYKDYFPQMGIAGSQKGIDLEKLRQLAQSALPTENDQQNVEAGGDGVEEGGDQDAEKEQEQKEESDTRAEDQDEMIDGGEEEEEGDFVDGEEEGDMDEDDEPDDEGEEDEGGDETMEGTGASGAVGGCDAGEELKEAKAVQEATPA